MNMLRDGGRNVKVKCRTSYVGYSLHTYRSTVHSYSSTVNSLNIKMI